MKRVLSFVLTLSILFSLIVPGVSAEGQQLANGQHTDHSACACAITGATCDSHAGANATALQWTPWGDKSGEESTLPKTAGNYYLTKQIQLSASVNSIGTGVNICLNGFDITMKAGGSLSYGLVRIGDNATVTIMNCKAVLENGKLKQGSAGIKNGVGNGTMPGGLWVNKGTNLSLIGVELSGNTSTSTNTGGWSGGALMTANNPTPNLNINYCRFDNNSATGNGGGAMGLTAGNVKISNTVFSGNKAKNTGSAIWAATNAVNLTLTNCEITGNTVTDSNTSGAIHMGNSGAKLTIRGNTVIENNIAKDKQGDIYLVANAKVTVGALEDGAKLKVNTASDLNAPADFLQVEKDGNNNVLANGKGVIVYTNRLAAGNKTNLVSFANSAYAFADNIHSHAACACAIAGATCADHTTAAAATEWTAWTSPTTLPTTTAGNYYLTCDVVVKANQMIKANLNICLNGYNIRYEGTTSVGMGIIRVDNSKVVTIMNCKAVIENGKLQENSAGIKNGVGGDTGPGGVWINQGANVTLLGVELSGNTGGSSRSDAWNGGALMTAQGTDPSVKIDYCRFVNNKAANGSGGAISLGDGSAIIRNTVFSGNEAKNKASAVWVANNAVSLELIDCEITGNKLTGSVASGAVELGNAGAKLIVRGKTIVENNQKGNIYLVNSSKMTVGAIADGAKLKVTTQSASGDANSFLLTEKDAGNQVLTPVIDPKTSSVILYENSDVVVGYNAQKNFYLAPVTDHWHADCACAITGATCDGHTGTAEEQPYIAWTSTTSLPTTAGRYYLTAPVKLSQTQAIGNGVIICLNNFSITMESGATLNNGMMRIGDNAAVTILNCQATVTGGKLAENSAGIKDAATTADNKPGAIWINSGAKLTLLGVAISNNTTAGASTGGWASGGIMTGNTNSGASDQELKINYCRFDGNSASGSAGGAISLRVGSADIRNTVFSGNSAKTRGGAIWTSNTAVALNLTNCDFIGNKTTDAEARGGAAVYTEKGAVTMTNVTMTANENAGHDGTAITCAGDSDLVLNNCVVTGNINTNSSALYKAAIVVRNSTATMIVSGNTVIEGNMNGTANKTATGTERNIMLRPGNSKLIIGALTADAKIKVSSGEHNVDGNNNPLAIADPNLLVQASTEAGNETPAIDAKTDGRIVYENDDQRIGYDATTGKFYFNVNFNSDHWHEDCACVIKNATCENHTAEKQAYKAWTSTDSLPTTAGRYYLTADVTISQTQVLQNGTILCLNGFSIKQADQRTDAANAAVVTLIRVTDNADVTILNCKASVTNGVLAENSAGMKNGTTNGTTAGAIHLNKGGKLTLLGVELSGNSSASSNTKGWGAGALMSAGDETNPTAMTIAYCRFADNKATVTSGGAISLRAGTADIRNTVFTGNEAAANGGAIHMFDTASKLTLTNCVFRGNKAGSADGQGAALNLAATKAEITITNTTFDANEAVKRGAAINIPRFDKTDATQNALKLTVTNSKFTNNKVTGSDAYGGAAMYIANGAVTLKNVTMTGNSNTDRHGSAMVIENTTNSTAVRMEDCTVTGNVNAKSFKRGAIVVIDTPCLTLAGKTLIHSNTNNGEAGNIYLREKNAGVKVDGLKAGSKIYITTGHHNVDTYDVSHPVADPDVFMTKVDNAAWDKTWVRYENNNMAVNYSEAEKFFFVVPADHVHCLCGDGKDTQCKHDSLTWMPWSDSKKLPTVSGNYYLTTNVTVEKSTELKGTTKINLCLNGKKIQYKGEGSVMFYNVIDETELSIADCTAKTTEKGYSAGQLSGATNSAIRIGGKATVNLYDGWIAQNTVVSSFGGGIRMVGAGTFNMYDGRINQNKTLASKEKDKDGKEYTVTKHGGGIGADNNNEGVVTVNLYGGEISGNTASGSGGGVHIKGGVLNLKGANVRWNNAGLNGGGISAQMSDLNLEKGNINDNKAINPKNEAGNETGLGGGVYAVGDNSAKKGTKVVLNGCRIYNNTAWKGGAMLLMYYMEMEYSSGMVSGNKADNNCGGIYVINQTHVVMSGGEVANNTAVSGGGIGIYRAKFTMTGGKIRNNSAGENGGGILAQKGAIVELSGGFLQDNQAINPKNEAGRETGMGGGIYTTGEKSPETDRVTLTLSDNIDIHGNKANKGGGVMVQNYSTLNIKGGKVYKNNAIHSGAGVFSANNTEMNISGGDIYGNTAPSAAGIATYIAKVTMTGGKVRDNVSSGNAAGILFQRKTDAVLSGGEIYGNRATNEKDAKGNSAGSGGGIYVMGGKSWDDKCTLEITGDVKIYNNKSVKGAGIMLQNYSEMKMTGGVVQNNTASNNGAGVFPANKSKFVMTGGTIRNNNAVSGAGLTAYQAELEILGGTITGNTAKEHGAAVLIQKESKVTINYVSIYGNNAGKNGGAIHISGTAKLNATGMKLTGNTAGEIGGALYASGDHTDIVLTECTIAENTAGTDCGGVTIMSHASLETNNCKINNNTSSGLGGGLYIRKGYLVMNGGEVCGNSATASGGGMHIEGVDIVMSRPVFVMNGGLISGNSAVNGGGVYLTRDTYSIFTEGVIEENVADFGGGIYSGATSMAEIGAIEVKNNTANVNGGGIYLRRGSRTVMTGTKVLDNKAKEGAGGIWVNDDFTVQDLTVKGNSSAKGVGGIFLASADYDGESYVSNVIKMGGNTYIYENSGEYEDLYISEGTYVNLPAAGLGQNAKIGVDLQSGLLTRTVIGSYNYEGGNLEYVITCGDRSLTDPETLPVQEDVDPTDPEAPVQEEEAGNNLIAIAGICGFVLLLAVVAVLVICKKKKSAIAEES